MRALRSTITLVTVLVMVPSTIPSKSLATPRAPTAPSALPLLQQPVDIWVVPGTTARQSVFASDADGEQLQFTKLSGPNFMSVAAKSHVGTITSATMSFAPGVTDIGAFDAAIEVSDGIATDQGQFTIHTVIPTRPSTGFVNFNTPHFDGQRRTMDPFVDPGTGIVFRGSGGSSVEVGIVKDAATSACVPGDLEDQKLGAADVGSDAIGLTGLGCRAEFGSALLPPCTVSVEFQTGAGAVVRLRLFDETGTRVATVSGTAAPALDPCFAFQGAPAVTRLTATSQQPVAYAVMELTQGNSVLVFDNLEYSSTPPPVTATLDLDPDVINLASRAPWVTAYIGLSEGTPADIDLTTLRLAGSVPADPKFATVGDLDGDGRKELMVKFSREALDPLLTLGVNDLSITGSLITGESIEASDQIRVIDPAGSDLAVSATPNPLHRSGTLNFKTSRAGYARMAIFDVRGSLVRVLMEAPSLEAGSHVVPFDGLGRRGQSLPTGVYFYKLVTTEGSSRGRIVLAR